MTVWSNLRRITGISELSWPNAKMDDDRVCDDVFLQLFSIELIDADRARFLIQEKSNYINKYVKDILYIDYLCFQKSTETFSNDIQPF